MKKVEAKKTFDAVQHMREQREELAELYQKDKGRYLEALDTSFQNFLRLKKSKTTIKEH